MTIGTLGRLIRSIVLASVGGVVSSNVLGAVLQFDPAGAYVTSINSLNIGGARYDVVFHLNTSFNDLFDPEGDLELISRPTFFSETADRTEAKSATAAVVAALGSDKRTSASPFNWDTFLVPYAWSYDPSVGIAYIQAAGDAGTTVASDHVGDGSFAFFANESWDDIPIATFSTAAAVPIPATGWLMAFGLSVLAYSASRRERAGSLRRVEGAAIASSKG